jgi:integrase
MASVSKDANGNVRVLFVGADRKRKAVRLGKMNAKLANEIKLKVEALSATRINNLPMDAGTAAWVAGIGDDLAAKLAAVGLIPERRSQTLGEFLNDYLDRRRMDGSKPATIVTIGRVMTDLTEFFGRSADLRALSVAEAERFKEGYQRRELAAATVYRRLKMCKMLFDHARRLKLVTENPFADVKGKNTNPADRQYYLSEIDALKLIDAANPTWRIIVALARFAGLRCPSEVLSLKWEHVNFATNRMTVPSPKTEHLEGKSYRVMPIFAALRPHLEEAFELAEPGEVYVVGGPQGAGYRATTQKPGGWVNTNLRTTFEKLIRRAGLVSWPRLFHNLRASCETDLMQRHPIHVVTAWLGNTPKIALGHYLQTLETDFEKAVRGGAESGAHAAQIRAQTGADDAGQKRTNPTDTPPIEAVPSGSVRSRSILSACTDGQGGTRTHTCCHARF